MTTAPITLKGELLFPTEYVAAAELKGRDVTLTIARVQVDELQRKGSSAKERKPIIYFTETKKKLVLNKTNAKTIAALYGGEVSAWAGKRITLFPTTDKFGRETVDCIRIRPKAPPAKGQAAPAPAQQQSEPDQDQGQSDPISDSDIDAAFGAGQ